MSGLTPMGSCVHCFKNRAMICTTCAENLVGDEHDRRVVLLALEWIKAYGTDGMKADATRMLPRLRETWNLR